MADGRSAFEIHAYRDDHWVLEDTRETESLARQFGKSVLNKPRVGGIRIVKTWRRGDGQITESTIHEEMRTASEPMVSIVPVDEAPMCTELPQFYKLDSRLTMGRLLRKYVEQVFLTPTELLHNYKALKKFTDSDSLYPSAVDRIATVQAKATGTDSRARRDELFRFGSQAAQKVKRIEEGGAAPEFKGKDFTAAYEKLKRGAPPEELSFYGMVVLARDLTQYRDWLGKLARVGELIKPDGTPEILALFDKVMSDLVSIPAALQDMLGQQANLGQAMQAMLDLHDKGKAAEKSDAANEMAIIGPLIAAGRLPETRAALLERVVRNLATSQPLSRNDPAKEKDAVRAVVLSLFRPEGILGGPDAAAAMTRRFVLLQEGGGLPALKNSVGAVLAVAKTLPERLIYLFELAKSDLAKDLKDTIVEQLRKIIEVNDLGALVPGAKDSTEKLLGVKHVFEIVRGGTALPPEERQRLIDRLDTLVADFIRREGIVEKLDNPNASLRDRSLRLVEFCGSGVLPEGRALKAIRERVIAHLRQPNFDKIFIEGIGDPQKCAEVLRDFHGRLVRAGFR